MPRTETEQQPATRRPPRSEERQNRDGLFAAILLAFFLHLLIFWATPREIFPEPPREVTEGRTHVKHAERLGTAFHSQDPSRTRRKRRPSLVASATATRSAEGAMRRTSPEISEVNSGGGRLPLGGDVLELAARAFGQQEEHREGACCSQAG